MDSTDARLAAYRQAIRDHLDSREAPATTDHYDSGEPCDAVRDAMLAGDYGYGGRRGRYSS